MSTWQRPPGSLLLGLERMLERELLARDWEVACNIEILPGREATSAKSGVHRPWFLGESRDTRKCTEVTAVYTWVLLA